MGHHESLYGCYVWQGNDICVSDTVILGMHIFAVSDNRMIDFIFSVQVLEDELTPSGSLEVSVSIP